MYSFALSDEEAKHINNLRLISPSQRAAIMDAAAMLARAYRPLKPIRRRQKTALRLV